MRSASLVTAAVIVLNLCTYGFTILAAHILGPSEFGAVAALMGLLLVLNVVGLGLQTTGARRVSQADGDHDLRQHEVLDLTARLTPALGVLCLIAAPALVHVFHLHSWVTALMVAVTAWAQAVALGQAGVLQGARRWPSVATLYAVNGIGRLGGGVAGMLWRQDALGAMTGVAVGALVPIAYGWVVLRDRPRPPLPPGRRRAVLTELAHNSHALVAFLALTNTDVLVARSSLPAHPAGLYAGGLILVKAVLFLPQFVIVLAFPALASGGSTRRNSRRIGLALVALLGVAVVAGTALLPHLALIFVGGDEYAAVKTLLWQFAVLGTALSLLQVLVYDIVAGQDHALVAVLWTAVAAIAVAGVVVGGTAGLLHWVLVVDVTATAVLLVLTGRREVPSA
ncbi:MAG TPA: polysaccharide biosynthesis protein [Marmoricola sp.]